MGTDTVAPIKDDDQKQLGGTKSPTQGHNDRTENAPNDMGLNRTTTIVQCTQGRKGGAHEGNISTSHFMRIQNTKETDTQKRNEE